MSDKTIRIKTNPDQVSSKYLKVKLEQDFDFLEILSLSITQEEVYRRFCSDYGVVVGRVIMNNGVGVPNAKVSIFIPIDENDLEDEEIRDLYPFEYINDKDVEGKRYNLLPDTKQFGCHTVVGSLPKKGDILDNDTLLDVHCKYYKYTAVTNSAGDFMIFGVPVGTHFMNIDCDISDIGIYSQRPYDLIREGQPRAAFDTTNKFKSGDDLDKLAHIKNQQTSVNVRPFWGDVDQCEIGITRLDVDLKYELKPSAIFMGSIFGDNEKNSVNKRCRPRKDLGRVCDTIANAGSIDMLRKDLDGKNERFDVEGGRVIDEDGAWAYQVPMNLDYMITNEFGDLVPTAEPNRGIPTRAKVRFRAGMDVSGGEGRLRTRAKHLIPHNPDTFAESDYSFDDSTTDIHFRDMYWNKIYSIKNFIPRFQTQGGGPFQVDVRAMLGIKDVDDCTGTHNPFPFNRLDSDINPLFSILCVIISILTSIVVLINSVVITLINTIILILNVVLLVICVSIRFITSIVCFLRYPFSSSNRKACRCNACIGPCSAGNCTCPNDIIPYIPCITLTCEDEEYGPGCFSGSLPLPWAATDKPPLKHWPNDVHAGHGATQTSPLGDGGYAFCVSASLAETLEVWEFDFYNDWVNGTLYSFLLKYRMKKRGKEKFCEYDCDEFGGGVDGDDDGDSDNKCKRNWLVDSCTGNGVKSSTSDMIKDGLIKSFDDELYYAAYTHQGDYKLFATDIIDLGAVFECDWQGKPKIQPLLVTTSYKTPSLLNEYDDVTNEIVVSGYDSPGISSGVFGGSGTPSLFFDINCLGLFTNTRNCTNIKRQCEIGVGLDEDRTDELPQLGCTPTGAGGGEPDVLINNCDIDNLFIRDAFVFLNNPSTGVNLSDAITPSQHALFDSTTYDSFRGIYPNTNINNPVKQPRGDSFYFYFGLTPGKSGLDLMNNKYFESCEFPIENDFVITALITDVTTNGGSDGEIDITIVGGVGPFTYEWSNGATTEDLTGVPAGTYTVTVTDSQGLESTSSFTVGQPYPITCFSSPTPVSINGASDGAIQMVSIGGGVGNYTTEISGPVSVTHTSIVGPTDAFLGLPEGTYTTMVTDFNGLTCVQTGVTITTPPALTITATSTDISCFGGVNGTIQFNYVTGVPPVSASTTGPAGFTSSLTTLTGLDDGTYTITMTDGIGQMATQNIVINEPAVISGLLSPTFITCNGDADGRLDFTGGAGGTGTFTYSWSGPTPSPITDTTPTLSPIGTATLPAGTYVLTVTDANGCVKDFNAEVKEPSVISVVEGTTIDTTCNAGADGSITVIATGGNPALVPAVGVYQFRIDGGPWQASNVFTGLAAATYTIEVKDGNSCTDSVMITVSEPTVVTVAGIVGGLGPTSYTITGVGGGGNGGPYTFELDGTGGFVSGPFTGLVAGAYNLQSKDSQGCLSVVTIINVP